MQLIRLAQARLQPVLLDLTILTPDCGQVDLIVLVLKMPAVRLRLVKVINHEQRSNGTFHHGCVRARSLPFVGAYRGNKREC